MQPDWDRWFNDHKILSSFYYESTPKKILVNRKELRSKKYQRKGKKPIIYSKFSPKFGVNNLNKQKIKNCFKWQKIKKKVRKYENNKNIL